MEPEAQPAMEHTPYKSPTRKLLRFFEKSRDNWKQKHHDVKKKLKHEQNLRRAAHKSREKWRDKHQDARQRIAQLKAELAALKKKTSR